MSEFELSQLFGPESVKVEYKYVVPPPKSLARLIASFANTEGGKIIFGVKDGPKPTVVGLPEDLAAWAVIQPALEHLRPRPLVSFSDDEINGKPIFILNIQKYPGPVSTDDNLYYIRKGTTTELVKASDVSHQAEQGTAKYSKVNQVLAKVKQSRSLASESKLDLLSHYSALLSLVDRCSDILYPFSPSQATKISEGKILLRLIHSSLVDTFEKYLRDLMLEIYLAMPSTLISDAKVSVKNVLKCQNMEEFVRFEANRRVEDLSRGALEEFIKKFRDSYHFDLFSENEKLNAEELYQIRHLYTHNNGRVDSKFLSKCPDQTLKVGQEHQLTVDELCDAAKLLLKVVDRVDREAVSKYYLNTPTEETS